jgi:hypothetical protein
MRTAITCLTIIGEVALKSDCMLTGYFNRPDLTDKAFRDWLVFDWRLWVHL